MAIFLALVGSVSATITHTLNSPSNYFYTESAPVFNWTATSDEVNTTNFTSRVQFKTNGTWVTNASVLCFNNTACNITKTLGTGFYNWRVQSEDADGNFTSISRWIEIGQSNYTQNWIVLENNTYIKGDLNVSGTGKFGAISFTNLNAVNGTFTGDVNIAGDLGVTGNITYYDILQANGTIRPQVTNTFNVGTSALLWKEMWTYDLFFPNAGGSIYSNATEIMRFGTNTVTNLYPAANCAAGYAQIGDNLSIRTCSLFLNAVLGDYLYLSGSSVGLNETNLNATIDARDSDTTYTAGTGLKLTTTTFSLNYLYLSNFTNDAGFYNANDAAQFGILNATTLNTGQGAYELYAMNQNVQTTSNVIFNTLNSTGAMKSTTLDTGQGANELYDMDQNVLTTSDVKYNSLNITGVAIGTYNCTLYDAYGCVIGYNATCRFLFSTDGTGKFSACNT